MNKKGDFGLETLSKYALVIIGAIILILVIWKLIPVINYISGTQSCQEWVAFQSSVQLGDLQLKAFKNPCLTTEETIKEGDNKEEIYKKLADSLDTCWMEYGSGKIDFFSDFDFGPSDTHCFICEEVIVEEKAEQNIDLDDFEIYLSNNYPTGSSLTYAERLVDAEHANIDFGEGVIELKSGTPLYSMFTINKKSAAAEGGVSGWISTISNSLLKTGGVILLGKQIPGGSKLTGVFISKTARMIGTKNVIVGTVLTVGLTATFIAADGSELFPSLLLVNGQEIVNQCDDMHYNPVSDNPTINIEGLNG